MAAANYPVGGALNSVKPTKKIGTLFYINKGSGVTLKEAYNLLNGRAVHKELTDKHDQKYQAWIQLDLTGKDKNGNHERKQYHQNYGYDLKEALSYYPIREMTKEDDMKSLVRSLEKGNVQMVTLETPGKDLRVFIEANPQYKSVNVYSNKMERLDKDRKKIKNGKQLSPLLLVRDEANAKLIIADGYHRLCAVYSLTEDVLIPCKIVNH